MKTVLTPINTFSTNDLPDVLQTALKEGKVYTPTGEQVGLDSNISQDEAVALYTVVRTLQPVTTAEIGFAKGVSAVTIVKALNDNGQGEHHVVDPFQAKYQNAGMEMVNRAGYASRLHFYEKFAEDVVPGLPELQFAFIDASHLFDLTLLEFTLLDKKLRVGGVIGLHDLWMPSLQKVVRYVLNNRSYAVYDQHIVTNLKESRRLKSRVIEPMGKWLRKIKNAEQYFAPELLQPWSNWEFPNMVFLQK